MASCALYFHKVGVAPIDGVCSTDILVVQPKADAWDAFVLFCVSNSDFVDYTVALSSGTRMPRTSWRDMAEYELALPTAHLAEAFDSLIDPSIRAIVGNIHQSRTLAELRDALLPKLISGEIRVGEVEEYLEDISS